MHIKMTLTAMVVYPALVIVMLMSLYWVTAAKKIRLTDMNVPEGAGISNYQSINMPGANSCDHCHLQGQSFLEIDLASARSR